MSSDSDNGGRPPHFRLSWEQWAGVALVAVCLTQSVVLYCQGSPARAAGTWVGCFLWGATGSLEVVAFVLAHGAWRAWRHGVRMEARYVRDEVQHGTSYNAYSHSSRRTTYTVQVYEVTDPLGRVQRHTHVPGWSRTPRPKRTVLVIPGEDSADSPLETYLIPLLGVPFCGCLGLVLGALAVIAVPGLLFW